MIIKITENTVAMFFVLFVCLFLLYFVFKLLCCLNNVNNVKFRAFMSWYGEEGCREEDEDSR